MDDFVRGGFAQVVTPTTDTGYKSYGAGRLLLPAGTNYLTNPSFEVDTDADGDCDSLSRQVGGGGSLTGQLVAGRLGGYAQRMVCAGAGPGATGYARFYLPMSAVGTFAQNDYVTFSGYLRFISAVETDGVEVYIEISEIAAAGNTLVTSAATGIAYTAPTDWFRFSKTYQCANASCSCVRARITAVLMEAGEAITFDVDDCMVEKSPFATPYFDGSSPGCSWSGAANASTSVRAVSDLYSPSPWTTLPASGTIAVVSSPLGANTAYAAEDIVGLYDGATARAKLCHAGGKHSMNVTAASTSAGTFAAGSTNCTIGRWDPAGTYLHFNGTAAANGAAPTVGGALDRISFAATGYAQRLAAFSDTCLTAADAVLLDNLMRGGGQAADVYRFFHERGYGLTLVPLDSDSRAYRRAA